MSPGLSPPMVPSTNGWPAPPAVRVSKTMPGVGVSVGFPPIGFSVRLARLPGPK